jgi:hypothetical protein
VAELEADNERLGFTDILADFDEPSQFFDGKQSLFMEATVVSLPFPRNPSSARLRAVYLQYFPAKVMNIWTIPSEVRSSRFFSVAAFQRPSSRCASGFLSTPWSALI